LDTITVHGVSDDERDISSYFAFGNASQLTLGRDSILIGTLTPHLHDATVEVLRRGPLRSGIIRSARTSLSERELEVLTWVQAGKTNQEIGLILSISEFTVKNHMKRIYTKLNAGNRAHAIAKAVHNGFLSPIPAIGLRGRPA
jgi:DNA-binding CsgD family transcriptional regulator